MEVVRKTRPAFFVIENVPQFLGSSSHRSLTEATKVGGVLAQYGLRSAVVHAADYGAVQIRKRAVILGYRHFDTGLPGCDARAARIGAESMADGADAWRGLPCPIEGGAPPAGGAGPDPTVARHAKTLDLHILPTISPLSAARYASIPRGGDRRDLPEHLKTDCWRRPTRGSADVLGRLDWDKPSVTIRTEFFKPEKGRYLHPEEHRGLTLAEGALLQGFGENFLWRGSRAEVARQIGNAVPVPLSRVLAAHVASALS